MVDFLKKEKCSDNFIVNASKRTINDIIKISQEAEAHKKIPKIIHCCFCDYLHLPDDIAQYMKTWEDNLGDYIIINWTPENFDISKSEWCTKCIKNKKFAFFADYIRVWAIYNFGGFYLDSDVICWKSLNDLLDLSYVFDREIGLDWGDPHFEYGVMGAQRGNFLMKACLDYYDSPNSYPKGHFMINGIMNFCGPHYVATICKKNGIELDFAKESITLEKYKEIVNRDKDRKIIHTFDASYLSAPVDNKQRWCQRNRTISEHTYTSHQFKNSWTP